MAARIAAARGRLSRAVTIYGGAALLRESVGVYALGAWFWPDPAPHIAELRSALGDAEFEQAWARGRAMTTRRCHRQRDRRDQRAAPSPAQPAVRRCRNAADTSNAAKTSLSPLYRRIRIPRRRKEAYQPDCRQMATLAQERLPSGRERERIPARAKRQPSPARGTRPRSRIGISPRSSILNPRAIGRPRSSPEASGSCWGGWGRRRTTGRERTVVVTVRRGGMRPYANVASARSN